VIWAHQLNGLLFGAAVPKIWLNPFFKSLVSIVVRPSVIATVAAAISKNFKVLGDPFVAR
jgi:hypothetical protein